MEKQKEQSKIKWDEERGALTTNKKLLFTLFNPVFNKNEIILDVGCGDGICLKDIVCNKVGLDISITNLKKAKEQNPDGLFVLGDAEHLPFKNEVFNKIFIVQVLHHLPSYKKCFEEIYRVAKAECRLYIEDHNSDGWLLIYPFYKLCDIISHLKGHFDEGPGVPLEDGVNYLNDIGFNVENVGSKGTCIKGMWFSVLTSRIMPYDRDIKLSDKPALFIDSFLRKTLPPKYLMWFKLEASKKVNYCKNRNKTTIIRMEY